MRLPDYNSPPWDRSTKIFVASAALVLMALAIWRFRSFISPIIFAIILAYLLNPMIGLVQRRINISRGKAVAVVYVVLIVALVGGIIALGVVAVDQGINLYNNFPVLLENAVLSLETQVDRLLNVAVVVGPLELNSSVLAQQVNGEQLMSQLYGLIEPAFTRGGSSATQFTQATITWFGLALLVFALSIYLARDAHKIGPAISNMAHQPGYRQDADRLIADFMAVWNSYLRGQVILALIMGTVVSLTLTILGVSNSLALGVLAGLLEFLPVIGPIISTIAAILVVLFQPDNFWGLSPLWHALAVAVAMLVLQQLENSLLVPRIVGNALDLHPLIIMVAVLMGASLAGILGAVLAAPVVATIKLFGGYAWRKILDLPPFAEVDEKEDPDPPDDEGRSKMAVAKK